MASPGTPVHGAIRSTRIFGLSIAVTSINLAAVEVTLVNVPNRELVLRHSLVPLGPSYDYCLIDCAPSLSLLTVNALMAADQVYIPIQVGYFALEGVQHLLTILELVRSELGHDRLEVGGVILTFYDVRQKMSLEVLEKVRGFFGDKVFPTVVPRTVKLDEAASYHQTIFEYSPNSVGARAYRRLAAEVLER
jgi:chromosome partitioning protein